MDQGLEENTQGQSLLQCKIRVLCENQTVFFQLSCNKVSRHLFFNPTNRVRNKWGSLLRPREIKISSKIAGFAART